MGLNSVLRCASLLILASQGVKANQIRNENNNLSENTLYCDTKGSCITELNSKKPTVTAIVPNHDGRYKIDVSKLELSLKKMRFSHDGVNQLLSKTMFLFANNPLLITFADLSKNDIQIFKQKQKDFEVLTGCDAKTLIWFDSINQAAYIERSAVSKVMLMKADNKSMKKIKGILRANNIKVTINGKVINHQELTNTMIFDWLKETESNIKKFLTKGDQLNIDLKQYYTKEKFLGLTSNISKLFSMSYALKNAVILAQYCDLQEIDFPESDLQELSDYYGLKEEKLVQWLLDHKHQKRKYITVTITNKEGARLESSVNYQAFAKKKKS